jgi:hypothetical protein
MISLSNNVHIFARANRSEALRYLFETVLECQVAKVEHPGMVEPMLIVRMPGGGNISIEFVDDADDADQPRLATWLELRTADPAALMQRVLSAGLHEVTHPGHPYYFMAPGGQVFTIAPVAT